MYTYVRLLLFVTELKFVYERCRACVASARAYRDAPVVANGT